MRFLTWYDYRTRFGAVGALLDRFAFRPLLGWATAWSFDRLRLWLEEGIEPRQALRIRTFQSRRTRRFDAYMIYSDARERIVDYLGSHEHLAVDIDLQVDQAGGLRLRSGAQRFYEYAFGFSFPMLFSGVADVREWYDESARRFRIVVDVHNRVWGKLFGYRGSFEVEWRKVVAGDVPTHVMPLRQEQRD